MPWSLEAANMMRPGPRADTVDSAEMALARTDPCNTSEVDGDPGYLHLPKPTLLWVPKNLNMGFIRDPTKKGGSGGLGFRAWVLREIILNIE